MLRTAALLLGALLAQSVAAAGPESTDLHTPLLAAEAALYRAVFDDCNADAVATLVADDLEFFHDRWGQIAKSKADFVNAIRSACERQRTGQDLPARRVLVPGSFKAYRMGDYGGLATGSHRFFQVPPGKPAVATETAQFANLWRFTEGQWRLARVFSYDHRPPAPDAGAP